MLSKSAAESFLVVPLLGKGLLSLDSLDPQDAKMAKENTQRHELASSVFPETHWTMLAAAKGDVSTERQAALSFLAGRYWKPVYCFVRRTGVEDERAKDLTQEFFAAALGTELFAKADPARGRFRSFVLTALKNFLANAYRAEQALKRRPQSGFVSIHELADSEGFHYEPPELAQRETPDVVFHRTWLSGLIRRVLHSLELECRATRKENHFELFRQRIVLPALEGGQPLSLRDLGQSLGISEKEASNCLITARRAYQRLLRAEIRLYAATDEEVAEEIEDLFRFLSGG